MVRSASSVLQDITNLVSQMASAAVCGVHCTVATSGRAPAVAARCPLPAAPPPPPRRRPNGTPPAPLSARLRSSAAAASRSWHRASRRACTDATRLPFCTGPFWHDFFQPSTRARARNTLSLWSPIRQKPIVVQCPPSNSKTSDRWCLLAPSAPVRHGRLGKSGGVPVAALWPLLRPPAALLSPSKAPPRPPSRCLRRRSSMLMDRHVAHRQHHADTMNTRVANRPSVCQSGAKPLRTLLGCSVSTPYAAGKAGPARDCASHAGR